MTTVSVSERRWVTSLEVTVRSDAHPARVLRAWAENRLHVEADRLELAASRFRPDSELAAVNARAGSWVVVSPLLRTLLGLGLVAAELTDGLCHPALGLQVDAAGYRLWREANVPRELVHADGRGNVAEAAVPAVDWRRIELVGDRVRIPRSSELDLGAVAKAWLADRLAESLAEDLGADVVANMGGDLRTVSSGMPWIVGVRHGDRGAHEDLLVTECGLATSSRTRRAWRSSAGPAHHLIDPRTGRPAETPWLAVSAFGADAVQANIAASAAMVAGGEAPGWLVEHGLDAVLSSAAGPVLRIGRWPSRWLLPPDPASPTAHSAAPSRALSPGRASGSGRWSDSVFSAQPRDSQVRSRMHRRDEGSPRFVFLAAVPGRQGVDRAPVAVEAGC
jgi:FAD:protein FMN transferase